MHTVNERGLVLVGCGFMGRALLEGWIAAGIEPDAVTVKDPAPSDWLRSQSGLRLNGPLPGAPAAIVIATKPQILDKVLPDFVALGGGKTVVVSIAAGAPVSVFETCFGAQTPVVRAMPNLPASVGAGITALFGNDAAGPDDMALVERLFEAVGTTVRLPDEDMLHLVTGLSGSGPAYVFSLAEALAAAGADLGLPADLAKVLAVQTVAGADRMLAAADADPTALRKAVTSKGGTTAAGLEAFMAEPHGIAALARHTVEAASNRSIALSQQPADGA